MNAYLRFDIYLGVLTFAVIASIWPVKKLERPFVLLRSFLLFTLVTEVTAHILALRYGNNMIVYNLYTPVALIIIAFYYQYVNPLFRRYPTGIIMATIGLLAAAINMLYIQPIHTFNSNFILFAGFCIIGMALATFYQLYIDSDEINLISNSNFQVSFIFLFYWSSTFISYAFHEVLDTTAFHGVYLFIWMVNLITYFLLGVVFLLYKRRIIDSA